MQRSKEFPMRERMCSSCGKYALSVDAYLVGKKKCVVCLRGYTKKKKRKKKKEKSRRRAHYRCTAGTKKGTRCKLKAYTPGGFCKVHRKRGKLHEGLVVKQEDAAHWIYTPIDALPFEETYNGYEGYLKTDHWERVKELVRTVWNYTCRVCGDRPPPYRLHAHHLPDGYKNLGRERWIDVTLLCDQCHNRHHKEVNGRNK